MNLALFDFDGTITSAPTYTGFVRFVVRPRRRVVGGVILSPLILGYRLGMVTQPAIMTAVSRVAFRGDELERVRRLGERYAGDILPGLVRPMALDRIAWHKNRGDRVVVVSASLDVYLEPWCRALGIEVICTQLEARGGVLTGRYIDGDCCGEEKSKRIRARYALERFAAVYAYGDTDEDRQMLEMADKRYFRWEKVRD
jgi:phosphatidylglycerophosphatase C